jgi:hypothetical protein
MGVVMLMRVFVRVICVNVRVGMRGSVRVRMVVDVLARPLEMDIELDAVDARFLSADRAQVIAGEAELPEFLLEPRGVNAEVNQRCDEHVAADAAETVEVEGLHRDSAARALI